MMNECSEGDSEYEVKRILDIAKKKEITTIVS
jgi:hypothetical protein